jgi:hypothetical protein
MDGRQSLVPLVKVGELISCDYDRPKCIRPGSRQAIEYFFDRKPEGVYCVGGLLLGAFFPLVGIHIQDLIQAIDEFGRIELIKWDHARLFQNF